MGWSFLPLRDNPQINREGFDCGDSDINQYITEQAASCQEEGYANSFLMVDSENSRLVGFYTLSSSVITPQEIPDEYRSPGMDFAMPAVLVGQFGISKDYQNKGLSLALLGDSYRRIALLYSGGSLAFRAIRVDTRTDQAKEFWIKQGYIPFKKRKSSLFIPVKTILRELMQ